MLGSLPPSLGETYERTLCNIDIHLIEDARRILTLLCFASRPLKVQELIDGVAVEIDGPVGLNRKRRLQHSDDIRDICLGLVDIDFTVDHTTQILHEEDITPTVRIAHFSVQEYLESERIRHQKAAVFGLNSATGHAEIAQICLIYLLEHDLSSSSLNQSLVEEFPLAQYAAMYWYRHYLNLTNPAPLIETLIVNLFRRQHSFAIWVKLYDMDNPYGRSMHSDGRGGEIGPPVYYASLLGLNHTLSKLLEEARGGNVTMSTLSLASIPSISKLVNTKGGRCDNPLQAASREGHAHVMQLLLENGADVNAQGGLYGNALQAASYQGHAQVVQLLLENGADVNAQGGLFGNALQTASYVGHAQVVRLLLENGADVNARDENGDSAFQVALSEGHGNIVQMLLDHGATIDALGDC